MSKTEDEAHKIAMCKLACEKRKSKDPKIEYEKCIIERHSSASSVESIFKAVVNSEYFSIRLAEAKESDSRIYAKRHIMAKKAFYVISAHMEDLDCKREKRSKYFLGKLKQSYGGRMFQVSCLSLQHAHLSHH